MSPVLVGRNAVKGADKLRRDPKQDWPYEHLFPPPGAIPVNQVGAIQVPTVAAGITLVTSYQVPTGSTFWLRAIMFEFTVNGVPNPFNPGDALFTVDRNQPIGLANVQGNPVQGLIQTPIPLGSWVFGVQWPFWMPYEFAELDLVSLKVTNVNLTPGTPQFIAGALCGYRVPVLGGSQR